MFDMTPFKREGGAVLELSKKEAEEFAGFYNSLPLPPPGCNSAWRLEIKAQCIWISFEAGFFYRLYGSLNHYERMGKRILQLDEIRFTQRDFGEIDIDSAINLSLLFANGG